MSWLRSCPCFGNGGWVAARSPERAAQPGCDDLASSVPCRRARAMSPQSQKDSFSDRPAEFRQSRACLKNEQLLAHCMQRSSVAGIASDLTACCLLKRRGESVGGRLSVTIAVGSER